MPKVDLKNPATRSQILDALRKKVNLEGVLHNIGTPQANPVHMKVDEHLQTDIYLKDGEVADDKGS